MTEADLLRAALDLARLQHVRVAHFRPARTGTGWRTAVQADGAGFPDLVLCGPGGVAYRELKTERGRLSRDQLGWGTALLDAGADYAVWTPADLRAPDIRLEMAILAGKENHDHLRG